MRAVAVALLIEEQRGEIVAGWRRDVERELGGEPVLAFAVGPLLREMSLALRGDESPLLAHPGTAADPGGAGARSAVLVRSGAAPARVAREFKLLHRAVWDAFRRAGAIVGADERRAADEWLDEALAAALDRQDRLRTRADLLDPAQAPRRAPPVWEPGALVPELVAVPPAARAPRTPPPLPSRAAPAMRHDAVPIVVPARPPPLPRAPTRPSLPVAEPDLAGLE